MIQSCLHTSNLDRDRLQNDLETILDEEFQTVCEDGSPGEIAELLSRFVAILRTGE